MINHCRTLLLNQLYSMKPSIGYPGEEYVPNSFSPVLLHNSLQVIWSVLFGSNPDRAFLNYRLAQYLNLLHNSDLAPYTTCFDPRITYQPSSLGAFNTLLTTPTITKLNNIVQNLYIYNSEPIRTETERLYSQWLITVLSSSTVQIDRQTQPLSSTVLNYTSSGGLSNPLSLVGTNNLSFSFQNTANGAWQISLLEEPTIGLAQVLNELDTNYQSAVYGLFSTPVEPYITFGNLYYEKRQSLALRLGAVLLGLAFQINSLL